MNDILGCAALSRWLKGSTQRMFQERNVRHVSKKRSGKSQPSPPSSGMLDLRYLYRGHIQSLHSQFSPRALKQWVPLLSSPSHGDTLTHSPPCKRERLPPACSWTAPRGHAPRGPRGT